MKKKRILQDMQPSFHNLEFALKLIKDFYHLLLFSFDCFFFFFLVGLFSKEHSFRTMRQKMVNCEEQLTLQLLLSMYVARSNKLAFSPLPPIFSLLFSFSIHLEIPLYPPFYTVILEFSVVCFSH